MSDELAPLAELELLEARLGRGTLAGADRNRAKAALVDASGLVRDETRRTFVDTEGELVVPQAIRTIVLRVAKRDFQNPQSRISRAVGPFSETYDRDSVTAYLTEAEKEVCARFRPRGSGGLHTISTTRGDCELQSTVWVEDTFGSELFPT